ncbi:MAG: class I SAM-dependent methyltransferase [Dehalococcoidales bacterium]|nr:MAG: class I SAM-dependent methyltransferase [Dehalococcoidales bacterium]
MSYNKTNMYDLEPHIAEIYDQVETYSDDVELIRKLIGGRGPLRILEPFCGTGRILIPLAFDGHELVGFDQSKGMLNRARTKVKQLPEQIQSRINLYEADVVKDKWPIGFDLVVLGGNCFYELATPEEQEKCMISAATSLHSGGHIYVDNDHMEGELDKSWQRSGVNQGFPTGTCSDSTRVESTMETIWSDVALRLARFRRCTRVTLPDGSIIENEYIQQKHPVSKVEVQTWLESHGFTVKQVYGDRTGNLYNKESPRAIFWAEKK